MRAGITLLEALAKASEVMVYNSTLGNVKTTKRALTEAIDAAFTSEVWYSEARRIRGRTGFRCPPREGAVWTYHRRQLVFG